VQAVIIALLAIAFYWNTFKHEYALDDTVVILKNEYVHQGFAGIPDILTKDAYFSYYEQLKSSNQLSGGRVPAIVNCHLCGGAAVFWRRYRPRTR
jgi:hypothetical protein